MTNILDEYSYDYEEPISKKQYVDGESEEVYDSSDLTDWHKLKMVAEKLGINIKKPRSGCRKCNGTGRVGHAVGSGEPLACNCIYDSKDLENVKPVKFYRQQKRQMIKNIRKQMKKNKKKANTDEKEV